MEFSESERLFSKLFPEHAERELRNRWVDLGGSFLPSGVIDNCIDRELEDKERSENRCFVGIDLSLTRDRTSIVVLEQEGEGLFSVARVESYDPRQFANEMIDLSFVTARLRVIFSRFSVINGYCDSRAEAGTILNARYREGWRFDPFAGTVPLNMQTWGSLASFLAEGRTQSSLVREDFIASVLRETRIRSEVLGIIPANRRFSTNSPSLVLPIATASTTPDWLATETTAKPISWGC